jgi:L-asparaginase II
MSDVELVQMIRAGVVDCVHRGYVTVVDNAGKLIFAAGDAGVVAYLRSCAKPFQAVAAVRSGAANKFGFTNQELAVIAGSHNGTQEHTHIVQGILQKIGADTTELGCGAGAPISRVAYEQLLLSGHKPSVLEHNCSGKHSGMLAACRAMGWDSAGYLAADHPVQQMILGIVAEYADMNVSDVAIGLDGCGVPTFGLPMHNTALLFARLAAAASDETSDLGIIARAMNQYPLLSSGDGRVDASLSLATNGRLICKDGAEGLLGIGIKDRGVGIAVKVLDGNQRAHIPVVSALMLDLGYINADEAAALDKLMPSVVRNGLGQSAANLRSVLHVTL